MSSELPGWTQPVNELHLCFNGSRITVNLHWNCDRFCTLCIKCKNGAPNKDIYSSWVDGYKHLVRLWSCMWKSLNCCVKYWCLCEKWCERFTQYWTSQKAAKTKLKKTSLLPDGRVGVIWNNVLMKCYTIIIMCVHVYIESTNCMLNTDKDAVCKVWAKLNKTPSPQIRLMTSAQIVCWYARVWESGQWDYAAKEGWRTVDLYSPPPIS